MNEKQFEIKLAAAVMLFASQLENVMDSSSDVLAESMAAKYESNPNMSIEDMAKEIASHVVAGLSKEFGLQEVPNETES